MNGQDAATLAILIFILGSILVVVGYFFFKPSERVHLYAAAPADGPMKVDLRTQEISAKTAFQLISGSKTAYRLHINVTMSKRDMDAMTNGGLDRLSLFSYRLPQGPEVMTDYFNSDLFRIRQVDFPNLTELDRSKDELTRGLHALRSRLDQAREHKRAGGTREQFEL